MLKKVTLAAVAAMALAAPAAAIGVQEFHDDDTETCSGTASATYEVANGACQAAAEADGGATSFKVGCDGTKSTSQWTLIYYDGADCKDDNALETAQGNTTTACAADLFKVDCTTDACYSGASTVQLEGGATVPMSQLNPGDRVLSADEDGNLFYDKVFRVTHWDEESAASYVKITTDSGNALELTGQHYVHVGGLEHKNLKLASEVAAGDELFVVEDGAVRTSVVKSAEQSSGKGLFNVHTLSSRIVVNGVVASHFSHESTWGESNHMTSLWYKMVDAASMIFGAQNARLE